MPKRIQLSRAKGWRMPPNTVKCDRSTILGNPFRPVDPKNRAHVEKSVAYFRRYVTPGADRSFSCGPEEGVTLAFIPPWHHAGEVRAAIGRLRGVNCACWCGLDDPCHVDVIIELANGDAHA